MTSENIPYADAILDETVFLLSDAAKLTISANNANDIPVINLNNVSTILLYKPENGVEISETGLTAIQKMTAALGQSEMDYAIINISKYPAFRFHHCVQYRQINKLICLGVSLEEIGLWIDLPMYKRLKFNEIELLISHKIEGISDDHKKLLWGNLKLMFGIK
jgi:hypothetical protein